MRTAHIGILAVLAWGRLSGEEIAPFAPSSGDPVMVRVQVEFVEADRELCAELMSEASGSIDATALRKTLAAGVKRGECKVLETMLVVARSGEKATAESIREFIFPTEYEPPSLSGSWVRSPEQSAEMKRRALAGLMEPPTSFETRNLGSSLEVAPSIDVQAGTIDLQFAPELVEFAGYEVHLSRTDRSGNLYETKSPLFLKKSIRNSIPCLDGRYVLAAVLTSTSADGLPNPKHQIMVLVKCDMLEVKEGSE